MVVGAGATYRKHLDGLGLDMPAIPGTFLKTRRSVIGPNDEINYPAITRQLDYEGELVVVLGSGLSADDPAGAVLGYTVGNDVSARDLQFSGGVTGMDMFSGKALDATSGVGPWIATRDEFPAGHPDLELETRVNGELRQSDRTGSMAWTVAELLAYVNARAAFHCGDVLFTGTCAGVALEDGRYLEPGDVVEVSLAGIGTLRNVVGSRPAS
jgi:2-keto-4-pentenoate hydratase/2-oxohepta-3-ene-1,7-dioic acid hydratase in catechol pathway